MALNLDARQITDILPMRQAINLMRNAFRILSKQEAICPVRLNLPVAERDANSLIMPCHLPGSGYFGIKTANVFPSNKSRGLPVIHSVYHLYSAETGVLLATMDGSLLTKLRTGAASGLAAELLADENASVLAVFGTGAQAETQIEAVRCVRGIREVLVFGRNRIAAEKFANRLRMMAPGRIRAADGPGDLRRSDVICTATTSRAPLFEVEAVKSGAHINAIGAYRPDMCEIPPKLIATCHLIVDQTTAALAEAGDIIQPLEAGRISKNHIAGELGELLEGEIPSKSPGDISVFKSVGSAVQDFVCAQYLFEQITEAK